MSYQKTKELGNQVIEIANNKEIDCLLCNCALGSIFQDHPKFQSAKIARLLPRDPQYCIGGLDDIEIMIDSNMKYTDLRILDSDGNIIHDFTSIIDISEYI